MVRAASTRMCAANLAVPRTAASQERLAWIVRLPAAPARGSAATLLTNSAALRGRCATNSRGSAASRMAAPAPTAVSAVAASAPMAPAPLLVHLAPRCAAATAFLLTAPQIGSSTPLTAPALRVNRLAPPAPPPISAVATAAPMVPALAIHRLARNASPALTAVAFSPARTSADTSPADFKGKARAGFLHREPCPFSSCPYLLKCLVEKFSEVHIHDHE
jgi:hypothetical protein